MIAKNARNVGHEVYYGHPPLDGPSRVLRSMCLPQDTRPRVTHTARLSCTPCWRWNHTLKPIQDVMAIPVFLWRRPWQALARGAVR